MSVRPDYVLRCPSIVTSLCYINQSLYTGDEAGTITVYDTDIMRPTGTILAHEASAVMRIVGCKEGYISQGRGGEVAVWEGQTCVTRTSVSSTAFCKLETVREELIAVGLDRGGEVELLDMKTLDSVFRLAPDGFDKKGLPWSLCCRGDGMYVGYESGDIVMFDVRQGGGQVCQRKVHNEIITTVDERGGEVVSGGPDGVIACYPADLTKVAKSEIKLKCKSAAEIRIREDGALFVAGCWDGGLRLFSCKSKKQLALIDAHSAQTVTDLVLSERNKITSAGRDKRVSFWTVY